MNTISHITCQRLLVLGQSDNYCCTFFDCGTQHHEQRELAYLEEEFPKNKSSYLEHTHGFHIGILICKVYPIFGIGACPLEIKLHDYLIFYFSALMSGRVH